MFENIVRLPGIKVDLCVPYENNIEYEEKQMVWLNTPSTIKFTANAKSLFLSKNQCSLDEMCDDTNYVFYILYKDTSEIIGVCSIKLAVNERNAMLHVLIGEEKYRARHIGTEVTAMLLKFCFEELNIHNVVALINSDDIASMRCLRHCSFEQVGLERETTFMGGKWTHTITMQILEDRYFATVKDIKSLVNIKNQEDNQMVDLIYGENNQEKERLLRENLIKQTRSNESINVNSNFFWSP